MAIFTRDQDYAGLVLVVVPASSPLDEDALDSALDTLKTTLQPLEAGLAVLSFIINSLDVIRGFLSSAKVTFRKANQIGNLNDIDLDTSWKGDTEAEDVLSSMILIGAPRRQIQCFNARDMSTSKGQMNATPGSELLVRIRRLHYASPPSEPSGRVSVPFTPTGHRWDRFDPWRDIDSFGDEFSSLRWDWA